MIQTGIEAIKQITPNTYVIILLGLFVAEKVISMTFRGITLLRGTMNGKGSERKDETKVLPCLQSPLFTGPWETHKQETHDTKLCSDRLETGLGKLLKESLLQTVEMKAQTAEIKKQTDVLEGIRRNGNKK